jgi:hypothetical protein
MRIVKVVSSLTPKGKAHAWGFQFFARAVRVVAGVALVFSGQTPTHPATSSAQAPKPNSSPTRSISSRDWDCSWNKRIPTNQFSTKGVEQGINEALKILENCSSCREFFGKFDAAAILKRLMKMGAIIVSEVMPKGLPVKGSLELIPVKETAAAVTIDFSPRQVGPFFKPCIYVNPRKFLVDDEASFERFGLEGLTLAQARAVAILHELAHIADVIPSDGSVAMGAEMSKKNTTCIRKKCLACDASRQPCPTTIASYLINDQIHSYARVRAEIGSRRFGTSSRESRHGP